MAIQKIAANIVERVLSFRVKGQFFGLNIASVKEIIDYKQVTKVPLVPDFIKGIYNLRGEVLPVIDLSRRLGWEATENTKMTCIIIAEVPFQEKFLDIGIMVDSVQAVLNLTAEETLDAPDFGANIRADFIYKVAKKNSEFMLILNLEKILDVDEIKVLREIAAKDSVEEHRYA